MVVGRSGCIVCVICKRHRFEIEGWSCQNSTSFVDECEGLAVKQFTRYVLGRVSITGQGDMAVYILMPEP
jgi:hypothetical protein